MVQDVQAHSGARPPLSTSQLEAASCLRECIGRIVAIWKEAIQNRALGPAPAFLGDVLPRMLQNLADALENPDWRYDDACSTGTAHGDHRLRQQTSAPTIGQVIDEYATARRIICESMNHDRIWPPQVMVRIHAFLDAAIHTAACELASMGQPCQVEASSRQRDTARDEHPASREDVAALLEEKQARERVVALLSHDLRSPLSSILIGAECLARRPGDEKLTSTLAPRLIRSANRIDRMIQDMLDASRLRAGRSVSLSSTSCDLAQIAAEAHEDYVLTYGPRVKLRSPDRASGVWDADAVRRVIDNLVGNAFKYGSHDTDVLVEVTDGPQRVRLAVHNWGNPLTEEEIAVLFDPYVRTRFAEGSDQRGWGLGLTLVQGVAKAQGGEAGASSSAESGTIFWFELPKLLSNATQA